MSFIDYTIMIRIKIFLIFFEIKNIEEELLLQPTEFRAYLKGKK